MTPLIWDWASGIPEMLTDGDNLYLVGHDTLGQSTNGEWGYYLPDALGSIRQTTDDVGAVSGSREWTPFGVEVGTARGGLGYTGEWLDSYTEFNYLRARWYIPQAGRFSSPDTIVPDFLSPQSINRYAYVLGNPIIYIDPSGHKAYIYCDKSTGVFKVVANIQIYGEGASDEVAQRYESAIEDIWNGRYNTSMESIGTAVNYHGIPVFFDVNVYYKRPNDYSWAREFVDLFATERPAIGEEMNMIYVYEGLMPQSGLQPHMLENDGSYWWDWGIWYADMADQIVAHEAAHLFGLEEGYDYNTGVTLPGYGGWIIGDDDGAPKPHPDEIERLIDMGCTPRTCELLLRLPMILKSY